MALFVFFLNRYLIHLLRLIEAIHILCGTKIDATALQIARIKLLHVVKDFEELYGHYNMVFNVHLLLHTVDCVQKNGPLFTYSNYCFEDNIGHLISYVHGTTDVLTQITDRYVLEKHLNAVIANSPRARQYHEQIANQSFSKTCNVGHNILVGQPKMIVMKFILRYLHKNNGTQIMAYRAIFVDSKVYFEISSALIKRTYDSFVCNPIENIYGEITHILVIEDEAYFIVNNKYRAVNLNASTCFIELVEKEGGETIIVSSSRVCSKFALIKTDTIITCSEFPNIFERN